MVATLGSGECGGSVHMIDLSEIVDSSVGLSSTSTRNRRVSVTTLNQTVWAADCNSVGTQAAFGEFILGLNCRIHHSSNFQSKLGHVFHFYILFLSHLYSYITLSSLAALIN